MKRAVLVGPSVELPKSRAAWVEKLLRANRPDFLVGVDGGIALLGKRKPDAVIGDWDSGDPALARRFAREGARMITLPQRKDFSDLHFALELALEAAPRELLLLGFTGGRPDHLLANLLEISGFAAMHASGSKFEKIAAIGPEAEYHFLTHRQPALELKSRPGTLISVFALGGPLRKVTMTGFEYNLSMQDLEPSSRGLSNVVRARRARISVRKGTLLLVIPVAIPNGS